MNNSRLLGSPWHIEGTKGYDQEGRKCFNCYFFDEGSCNKKMIPITTNNAKMCRDYKNRIIEVYLNKSKEEEYKTYEEKQAVEQFVRDINNGIKIESNDTVEIYDYELNEKISKCINDKEDIFTQMMIDKRTTETFMYNGKKYRILIIIKNRVGKDEKTKKQKSNIKKQEEQNNKTVVKAFIKEIKYLRKILPLVHKYSKKNYYEKIYNEYIELESELKKEFPKEYKKTFIKSKNKNVGRKLKDKKLKEYKEELRYLERIKKSRDWDNERMKILEYKEMKTKKMINRREKKLKRKEESIINKNR